VNNTTDKKNHGHDSKMLNGPGKKNCHTWIVCGQKLPHWKI